jgi:ABC-type bacteriocin/lantibiotic exporter with double-glycine peptidase domain
VTASLLTYYWDTPGTSEYALASELSVAVDVDALDGVSLADIAALLDARGIRSRAFRVTPAELESLLASGYAPLVGHYDQPSDHFVLLLHFNSDNGLIVVGDPARGMRAIDADGFLARFSGIVLVLASNRVSRMQNVVDATVEQALSQAEAISATARRLRLR